MKRLFIGIFALAFLGTKVFSQEFELNLPLEIGIFSAGIAINASAFIFEEDYDKWDGTIYDKDEINAFDRPLAQDYNKVLDRCGDVSVVLTAITPALIVATNRDKWLETGIMYLESAIFANGVKELGKSLVARKRPYMYFEDPEEDGVKSNDWKDSFPSGHSTWAFNAASFTSYVFCKYNPDSSFKIPVVAGSFALAATTAAFRISSGNHFLTDTLAGAGIGCFSGFFIPWLHTFKFSHKNDPIISGINLGPQTVSFTYRF